MSDKQKYLKILIIILILLWAYSITSAQIPPESWQPNEIGIFYFQGLSQHDYLNVGWTRMAIPWCILQPDSMTWDWNRFENRYHQTADAGIKVLLTLRIGQGWMNGLPPSEEETFSVPPTDLSETWDEAFGHSPNYFNFIYEVVNHFHPAGINIENEANADNFYQGSVKEYIRILKTAKLAATKADSNTRVLDSGFACRAWALTVAWDRYQSGRWSSEETYHFLREYAFHFGELLESHEQLDEFLQNSQDHIDFILNTLPLLKDNIDYLNFHSYADFNHIDTVIVWIREKMNEANYQAPLFCNEHGIKINPDSSYDKQGLDQARDLFKQVITMWASGVETTIRFPFDREEAGTVGLFSQPDSLWLAARTLQLLGSKIGGRCRFSGAISSGPGIYRYVFADSSGKRVLEADWSEDGEVDVIIDIPQGCTRIHLIDAVCNVTEMEALDGTVSIELNATPIMIEFIDSETPVHTSPGKTQTSPPVLYPPFPNPFNCGVTIQFLLPCGQHVRLDIFNILGQQIDTIIDHPMTAGRHSFLWNARSISSGSYLVQLRTPSFTKHQKIKFIK